MKEVIGFQPQPDFPIEDINEQNAAMAEIYLEMATESEAYVDLHRETLQMLHNLGNAALVGANLDPGNNRGEYVAFCHGFSLVDYLAVLLDSRPFAKIQSGASMNRLYLQHGEMADFELWQRREMWVQTHQNTMELMRAVSDKRDETTKQFAARAMGAQIASEFLY